MDILIPNFELPKDVWVELRIYPNGDVYESFDASLSVDKPFSKAVEIPDNFWTFVQMMKNNADAQEKAISEESNGHTD